MPFPKPSDKETEKEFIDRCMGDLVSEYEDTKQRFAICNSIWRQKDMAKKSKEKALETVSIEGNEIAAVGKWQGMANGKPAEINITAKDLEAMVEAYNELTNNEKVNYEPPVKLGHDDKQKLVQEDGYPAAGWIASLKKVGNKLVADFRDVPKKIAELIQAGAYRKMSPEFYSDYSIGGKVYSRVLKAVALLGADIQAIKSTKDIADLYGSEAMLDENGVAYQTLLFAEGEVTLDEIMSDLDAWLTKAEGKIHGKVGSPAIRTYLREVKGKLKALMAKKTNELSESLSKRVDAIYSAWRAQMPHPIIQDYDSGWVTETFDDYVIIEMTGKFFKIPYSEQDGNIIFDLSKIEEVKREVNYVKAAETLAEKVTKREDGIDFPAEAYAYVPDPEKPSEWKIRLWEDMEQKETVAQIGRAMAAFSPGGFRGQKVEIPAEDKDKVKTKIVEAWKRVNPDRDVSEMPRYMLQENIDEEGIMDKELRELLGIDEEADVLATVKALKESAEPKTEVVSLVEHQATESRVKILETELAERKRDELIGKAIQSGKLTPAQAKLPVLLTLAEKDPSGFQAFVDSQPKVIEFPEKGREGGSPDEIQLTEAEISLGEKLGVSKEALMKAKK